MSEDDEPVTSDGTMSDDSDADEMAESATGTGMPRADRATVVSAPKKSRSLVDYASLDRILHQKPKTHGTTANTSGDDLRDMAELHMTKYEYARVKGVRMEQLQRGAIPCVDYAGLNKDTVETVFRREFVTGRMPLMVIRELPDGKAQYYKIRDFVDRVSAVYD